MPDEIEVAAQIGRAALDLPSLDLESDETGIHVVSIGAGGRTWRRKTVEGPFQPGRMLVGAVIDTGAVTGVVRVYGADWLEVRTRTQEMFEAFSQMRYMMMVTIEGVLDIYICEPADISIVGGDTWQKPQLYEAMQEFQFSAPYEPGAQS